MGAAEWVLLALVLAGAAVRGMACAALWPVATTLSDAATYAIDAGHNPLVDPQHPAGYPALLALIGVFTRNVAVAVLLQHVLGIVAAVLLFAAVRRLVGSPWPALVPAAVVLLDSDEVFLEHNIMSEGPFLFLLAFALYASVRAMDAPDRSWRRWPCAAAVTIAAATMVRSAGVFAIPVLATAIALGRPPRMHVRWCMAASFAAVATMLLAGYAAANLVNNGRFEIAPASGWHLYGRVAPFADCHRFRPPAGTAALCEWTPAAARSGPDFYLYNRQSPARRKFVHIGNHDGEVGAFAVQAVLHQPGALMQAFWVDVRRYFVPSWHVHGWYRGWDIQPQLDWSRVGGDRYTRETITGLTSFFSRFVPQRNLSLVIVMHDYEQVAGFGATLLTVCTLLSGLGLFIGARRSRVGVLLFGVGGLAQLIMPTISVLYMGRYTVPLAGMFAAGGAIALWSVSQSAGAWLLRARTVSGFRRPPKRAAAVQTMSGTMDARES
jgi:hypothetical protein